MRLLKNEKGVALLMVLVLAAILLAIMAGLIYMVTTGTQMSGMQKRYKTALQAAVGGSDITYQFIQKRGITATTDILRNTLNTGGLGVSYYDQPGCSGTNSISGDTFNGLAAKLNSSTSVWTAGCSNTLTITPGDTTTYDITFQLGVNPTYNVYAKIVDTREGNSALIDEGLYGKGVSEGNAGETPVQSKPYLYTIEIDAENAANPRERAKLSILYQY